MFLPSLPLTAVDCGSTIVGLDVHATASCTGNNKFDGDACTATCVQGYLGGSQRYTCGTNASWVGNLTCRGKGECCVSCGCG